LQFAISTPQSVHGRYRAEGSVDMIRAHMSVSLDGYAAGSEITPDRAMGRGGDELHAWMSAGQPDPVDRAIAASIFSTDIVGAVLMGRRTLDVGLAHWGEDGTFGVPCFVVTHNRRQPIVKGPTTFTFVTGGLGDALEQATVAAQGKRVQVMGVDVVRQTLTAGLIDELQITLVPIVLGGGATLFGNLESGVARFEQVEARSSATVTHLRYRALRSTDAAADL
jgi:dihydrofolate reductase